jgi:hypothetical protein
MKTSRATMTTALLCAVAGCAGSAPQTPEPAAATGKADSTANATYSYTCDGGTGDVSIDVDANAKAIVVTNTESGARYLAGKKVHSVISFHVDPKDDNSDPVLMGSDCTASASILSRGKTIHLNLLGGESAAAYVCKLDQPDTQCFGEGDCESFETCTNGTCFAKSCKTDEDCGGFGVCDTEAAKPFCMSP